MKRIIYIVCILLILAIFAGCTPTRYTEFQSEKEEQTAQSIIENYLKGRYSKYSVDECNMINGNVKGQNIYAGYYGSHIIGGRFSAEGNHYVFYVNNETGDVYTDELFAEAEKLETERINEYFADEKEHIGQLVMTLSLEQTLESHNVDDDRNNAVEVIESRIDNVLLMKSAAGEVTEFTADMADRVLFTNISVIYSCSEMRAFPTERLYEFFEERKEFTGTTYNIWNLEKDAFDEMLGGKSFYEIEKKPEHWFGEHLPGSGDIGVYSYYGPEEESEEEDDEVCNVEFRYDKVMDPQTEPSFRETDGVITMTLDGNDKYTVKIIDADELELLIFGRTPLYVSTNMEAYERDEEDESLYFYVMALNGTQNWALYFCTDIAPLSEEETLPFDKGIHFFVGQMETVPDIEWQ